MVAAAMAKATQELKKSNEEGLKALVMSLMAGDEPTGNAAGTNASANTSAATAEISSAKTAKLQGILKKVVNFPKGTQN